MRNNSIQCCYNIVPKIPSFQQKLWDVQEKKENRKYDPYMGKKTSTETAYENTQKSDFIDKDFKESVLNNVQRTKGSLA